jgi:hypothetical protein
MVNLVVLDKVAHVGYIDYHGIVFLLLNYQRHIVHVDELTQSGKHSPHSH